MDKSKGKNNEIQELREVGSDGYYYECVKCGEEGDLICCDSCLCTYHLECLIPPLKVVPMGCWYCPNCSKYIRGKRRRLRKKVAKDLSDCSVCSKTKMKFVSSKEKAFWTRSNPSQKFILHDGSTKEFQGPDSSSDSDDEHKRLLILCDAAEEKPPEKDTNKHQQSDTEEMVEIQDLDSTQTQGKQAPQKKGCNSSNSRLHARGKGKEILEVQQQDPKHIRENLLLNDPVINSNETTELVKQLVYQIHHIQASLIVNRKLRSKLQPRRIQSQCSSSGPADGQKQSSNLEIAKNVESVHSNASKDKGKGAAVEYVRTNVSKDKGKGVAVECSLFISSNSQGTSAITQIEPLLKETIPSFTSQSESATPSTPTNSVFVNTDEWSEEELNALWISVRKHGQGNWEAVLKDQDSYLSCLKNKTSAELAKKWQHEFKKMQPNPVQVELEPASESSKETTLDFNRTIQDGRNLQWCMADIYSPKPTVMSNSINSADGGFQDTGSYLRPQALQLSPEVWRSNQAGPSTARLEPMIHELLVQTLRQKADPLVDLRHFRMPPSLIPSLIEATSLTTERGSVLPRVEPGVDHRLYLGGTFPLTRVWPQISSDQSSGTRNNPIVVDVDKRGQSSHGNNFSC